MIQGELFPDEQAAKREKLYVRILGSLAEIIAFSKGLSIPEIHVSLQKAVDETLDNLHESKER